MQWVGGWVGGWMDNLKLNQTRMSLCMTMELGEIINSAFRTKPLHLSEHSCDDPEIGSNSKICPPHSPLLRKLAKLVQIGKLFLVNLRASFTGF